MKRRLFTLLLALVLLISVIPLAASAKTVEGYTKREVIGTDTKYTFPDNTYVTIGPDGRVKESTSPDFAVGDDVSIGAAHKHKYVPGYNRLRHFSACECGSLIRVSRHDDPAEAENGCCSCGYQYYTNADLTYLWLTNVRLDTPFDKDVTEYTAKTVSWKNVKKTSIRTASVDARATIELPSDTSIQEGTNVFKITVTAEDGVTTKTYTVTVTKD